MKIYCLSPVFIFLLLNLCFSHSAIASGIIDDSSKNKTVINGDVRINSEKFNYLEVNGSLTFKNLIIQNDLKVNGNLSGKRLSCVKLVNNGKVDIIGFKVDNIESNGYFKGENVNVSSKARFIGDTEIIDSKLNNVFVRGGAGIYNSQIQNLELHSSEALISNSKIFGVIRIKKIEDKHNLELFGLKIIDSTVLQTLQLREGAVVNGDIIFEGERGELHIYDKAEVKGVVSNAKIINK